MATKKGETMKPVEPMEPIETAKGSRIKINAIYEDAKDVHVRNYILYNKGNNYLYLDEAFTEKVDCDTLMDLCSKGVLVYYPNSGSYANVIGFGKDSLNGYAMAHVQGVSERIHFYSKEYVENGLVDPGPGDVNIKQ